MLSGAQIGLDTYLARRRREAGARGFAPRRRPAMAPLPA
jgi:hypothetical protein